MSVTIHRRLTRRAVGVLLAASMAAGVGVNGEGPSEKKGEPMLPYKLSFSVQTGELEANQLTIDHEGVVTASIGYSVPGSPVRAIGRFSLAAGPSDPELVAIGTMITQGRLTTGRPHATAQQPGRRYMRLDIEMDGKESKHIVDTAAVPPESLGNLAVNLTRLMTRVGAEAPQRAVSIKPEFAPTAGAAGDRLRVTLDVRNAGPLRTEIRNFAGFRRGGNDSLRIEFWKPAATTGQLRSFAGALDLTGEEWRVAENTSIRPRDPYLKLEGSGSLRAWTEIRLPKSEPGPLLAELVYYAHVDSDAEKGNDGLVVGTYRAEPVSVTILPPPAR